MYFVYILSNNSNKVLYTGMTDNLCFRVQEHKLKLNEGFTSRYNVNKLIYFEEHESYDEAAVREKQLKAGSRMKKLQLIVKTNPDWHDLFHEILDKYNPELEFEDCEQREAISK